MADKYAQKVEYCTAGVCINFKASRQKGAIQNETITKNTLFFGVCIRIPLASV